MKKTLYILLAGVLVLSVISCTTPPRDILDRMVALSKAGDHAGAKLHCGGDLLRLIEENEKWNSEMIAAGMPESDIQIFDIWAKATEITEKEVTGDTAKYDVTMGHVTITFVLKRTNGTWKVCDFENGGTAADALEVLDEMKKMREVKDMGEIMEEMPEIPEPQPEED